MVQILSVVRFDTPAMIARQPETPNLMWVMIKSEQS
jgi:hypothetical protein